MRYNRGTEIKLDDFGNLNVVYGSIDKRNPKTIYLRISGWGNPINFNDDNDYRAIIRKFDKHIRALLFKELGKNFNNQMSVVDLDMRESGIINNKSSFMSCEITLFQSSVISLYSNEVNENIKNILEILITEVFEDNEYFEFYKKKINAKEALIEA
jgi:hypothetical protein